MAWMKRLAAPAWWPIERKTHKFITVPRGSHAKLASLPLAIIVRDILKIAKTATEARKVIRAGNILVDGRHVKDETFGVGPMDTIEIPTLGKSWRLVPGKKGRMQFVEIPGNESKLKLCRIMDKTVNNKGRLQINLHDGRNILVTEKAYKTIDSLLLEVPAQKVVNHFQFEPGATVLVLRGDAAGTVARVKEIDRPRKRVWLISGEKTFETPISTIIVVGKESPAITLM
jgi:small subunit ribosomal protein S4e